jgi:hypothetical protein
MRLEASSTFHKKGGSVLSRLYLLSFWMIRSER